MIFDINLLLFPFIHYIIMSMMVIYYKNRHTSVIQKRSWSIVMIIAGLYWIVIAIDMLRLYGIYSLNTTAAFIVFPLLFFFKVVRMIDILNRHYWHLLVLQNTQFSTLDLFLMDFMNIDALQDTCTDSDTMISFKSSPFELKRFVKIVVLFTIFIIVVGLSCGILPMYLLGIEQVTEMYLVYLGSSFLLLVFALICLNNDQFYIKQELMASVSIVLLWGIVVEIVQFFISHPILEYKWIILALLECFIMLGCPVLYLKCLGYPRRTKTTLTATPSTLNQILQDPTSYLEFRTSVAQDYCSENILFLEALERLKVADSTEFISISNYLIKLFIKDSGEMALNLPLSIKQTIYKQLPLDASYAIFIEAESHIKHLLITNNLPRYLRRIQ